MDVAAGVLRTLLPKLAKLLQDEYNLHKGARKGIEFLYKELETMQAALRKVSEVPREQLDDLQRIWARDVRDLSFDMEDIVDTFMVEVDGPDPPSKRGAKKISRKMKRKVTKVMARRGVAQEIDDIKERVRELAERRDRYNFDAIAPANRTHVDTCISALYNKVTELVGIDEAKEQVIARLTKGYAADQQEKIVVSIAGFGGLGKTTLAKAVYDDIKGQFDCMAFVSVSRDPNTQKLLKDMLYQLDETRFEDIHSKMLGERFLIAKLIECLHNKRYLIVIDDIWDKTPWDTVIRHALIENNMRSRIITTTRNVSVAKHVGDCYNLKPLSDESSEMLFYGRIFGSKEKCPKQFSEVSKKILKKCGGVPLAIITTSSLLANKSENIKVWNDVCDSIGSGLGRNPGMDDIRNILMLSYYDLPSHLKTCLVYLSIFPEDYEIEKDRLIWRWAAEGFIQQDQIAGYQSFLEIGEGYFFELLNRSLIQPAHMKEDGEPHACRVHDAVHDLIIFLSAEQCFINTVLGSDGMKSKVRWLSLHEKITWPTMKMPKLRSLTIFEPARIETDPTPSFSSYRLLRVLDLRGFFINNLASLGFLGSLSYLRYLGLSSSRMYFDQNVDCLPIEIGKLHFLQTLDVYETEVYELPSSITELRQLVCLRGGRGGTTASTLPYWVKKLSYNELIQSGIAAPALFTWLASNIFLSQQISTSHQSLADQRYFSSHNKSAAATCRQARLEHLARLALKRSRETIGSILPDGLKKLTSLEVLESGIVTSKRIAAELGHLTQLRVLKVRVSLSLPDDKDAADDKLRACGKAMMESLGKLTKLETLYMVLQQLVDLNCSVEEPLGNLRWLHLLRHNLVPTWIRPALLPGLSYLYLRVEREQREDIQVLGTLPCLTYLYFTVRLPPEPRRTLERCVVGPNAFPRLVKCEFDIAGGGVVPRTFQGGAMSRLQEFTLRINYYVEFDDDDSGPKVNDMALAHLPSLRSVTVLGLQYYKVDACKERKDRVEKLREKLQHEAAVHPNYPSILDDRHSPSGWEYIMDQDPEDEPFEEVTESEGFEDSEQPPDFVEESEPFEDFQEQEYQEPEQHHLGFEDEGRFEDYPGDEF